LDGDARTGFDAGFDCVVDFPFDEPEPFDEFADVEADALPALALDEVEPPTD
jgi:hypothetical protein